MQQLSSQNLHEQDLETASLADLNLRVQQLLRQIDQREKIHEQKNSTPSSLSSSDLQAMQRHLDQLPQNDLYNIVRQKVHQAERIDNGFQIPVHNKPKRG